MTKKIDSLQYLETTELSLIALLRLQGYPIEKTSKQGSKVIFHLPKDDNLENLIRDFWEHKLSVDPLSYFNSIKETKSYIYK